MGSCHVPDRKRRFFAARSDAIGPSWIWRHVRPESEMRRITDIAERPPAVSIYCENGDIAVLGEEGAPLNLEDSSKLFGVLPYAIDPEAADRLWTLSEQLLGLKQHEAV
jgi:hypothetical protein